MKVKIEDSKYKYQGLERYNRIIKGELVETKKHIERLHSSTKKLNEQLKKQNPKGGRLVLVIIVPTHPK